MGAAQTARLSESRAAPVAAAYAQQLLDSFGLRAANALDLPDEHPALSWARSGLMALTGHADGPPLMCPVPLAACADGMLAALASLAPAGSLDGLRGSRLLAERAAITGYTRRGAIAPGGCHLLECADGWLAVNLTRDEDWQMLPAWLECDVSADWGGITSIVSARSAWELVERARELGLAVAVNPSFPQGICPPPFGRGAGVRAYPADGPHPSLRDTFSQREKDESPLVVDLSSLWAGPLCSHLLQLCGAEVFKLESLQRPDGARNGHFAFFDLLNHGKRSVTLDFATDQGRAQLRELLAKADIVIEGTRPRALRQLGIEAETLIRDNPRLTWVSITGHGRGDPQENWIAYGDDAGVAAGLSEIMYQASGQRVFVGDAIADPLTGLHAAVAAYASFQQGGGRLLSLSLVDVVRRCVAFDLPSSLRALRQRQREWSALV
ncbi:MAG: CoA transferase [Nevskiales bacterium]